MAIDKNTVAKEAQKFAAKGQYDKAIAEWKKLLKESPHDPNLYNTIGDLCLKKNAKPEAVDAYRRAADILAQDGFTSKAIALYKKVLNIDNNQAEVHLALGDMNAEKGLTGNALENYKHVADLYTQQKDTVKALRVYQKMADLNPANIAFRIKLADMYAKQGMKAEATAAFLSAADVHIENSAFTEARQLFEKILAFEPNNKDVYFKAGILYLKEGKFNEACKALKPVYEKDPANRDLADMYLDALLKAGKDQDAAQVIAKSLAEDPARTDLLEKLLEMQLVKKDYDRALETASSLAAVCSGRDDHEGAEAYLKRFIVACPDFAPGRRKLAEYYISVRRDDDAAKTFFHAARIMSDEGDRDGAKEALDRALEISPGMPEARDLVEHLSSEVAPQEPIQEEAEPAPAELETIQERAQEFTPVSPPEEPPFGEAQAGPAEAAAFEPTAPEPDATAEPPVESQPAETAPVVPQMDPAIAEAFTEADVLIKYGLAMKAVDQLETLARKFPDSPQVRIKLHNVYGDLGQMTKAAAHMLALADIYAGRGMQDEEQDVLRSALAIDPSNSEVRSKLGIGLEPESAPPVETAEEAPLEREHPSAPPVDEFPGTPAPMDMDVFEGFDAGARATEYVPPEPSAPAFEEPMPIEAAPQEPEFPGPGAMPEEQSHAEAVELEPHSYLEGAAPPVEEAAFAPTPPEHAQREPEPQAAPAPDIDEIWSEAEFYYQQGLFAEAKKHYAKIIGLNPDEARAINRLSEISREEEETKEFTRLADAVESLEEAITADAGTQELPMSASDEDAVRTLMSEIAELKKPAKNPVSSQPSHPMLEVEYIPPPPPKDVPRRQPAPFEEAEVNGEPSPFAAFATDRDRGPSLQQRQPVNDRAAFKPAPPAPEEDFFDLGEALKKEAASAPAAKTSDDFFDLASELRDELSTIAVPSRPAAPAEEQSLDEIFEEFKRGVEQQTNKEEADTHYNLGVAYKEMGLLDDAIEEFSLTPQGETKFMHSRYLLGLCFMEKSEYTGAIREIDYALTYSEGMGEDEKSRVEMRYDLGLAYQGAGNASAALREFQIVQRIDPRYRDVAEKIRDLRKGDAISLTQLKGDIEKEISSKFLEEGERIEREEKNRKNERVRR